jgi:hypothetical protein
MYIRTVGSTIKAYLGRVGILRESQFAVTLGRIKASELDESVRAIGVQEGRRRSRQDSFRVLGERSFPISTRFEVSRLLLAISSLVEILSRNVDGWELVRRGGGGRSLLVRGSRFNGIQQSRNVGSNRI